MNPIFSVGMSGLTVATAKLAVSANNVANSQTEGFVPSEVVAREAQGGGVTGQIVNAEDPVASARADRALSGTDLPREVVSQMAAAASFKANLATLRTADEIQGALLSIKA